MWSDWLFCDYGFSVSALWCPFATPTILLGFILCWAWGISSRLLQQSTATAPYLGWGIAPRHQPSWPWTWNSSSRPSCAHTAYCSLDVGLLLFAKNSMKRQNDRILKEELPRSVGAQYTTGDQWRNNSRKNEGMEPKQKQYPAVDVPGDRTKFRCCKEQYCIGTWDGRSMNQGKLKVVKQEMTRWYL